MMLTKISLERLLAGSSRLQDHRQRNCVIRSVTVESAVLSGRHVKTNEDVYPRSSSPPLPEYTDPSDKTVQCDEDTIMSIGLSRITTWSPTQSLYYFRINNMHAAKTLYKHQDSYQRNLLRIDNYLQAKSTQTETGSLCARCIRP